MAQNTPPITSRNLDDKKIKVLVYPAQRPVLDPIEKLWAYFKKNVRDKNPSNLKELEAVAREEWRKIPVCVYGDPNKELSKMIKGNNWG